MIRAGARGYVTKTIAADELADAIERVQDGDAVFSPRLAGFVLDAFAGDAARHRRPRARPPHRPGAGGHAPHRPGLRLQGGAPGGCDLSVKTVETHVSAVLRKLQLSNRHELTRWAADRRLI